MKLPRVGRARRVFLDGPNADDLRDAIDRTGVASRHVSLNGPNADRG